MTGMLKNSPSLSAKAKKGNDRSCWKKLCLRFFYISLFITFPSFSIVAQESKVYDNLTHYSEILSKSKQFSIYLPPDYQNSGEDYPVLYLLHGGGDNHRSWIEDGSIQQIMDEAIHSGKIRPMVLVMPDAEMTYYMNNVNGDYQFEDYIIHEFIPYVERNYRILDQKKYRAIAGVSMGGFGALLYSIHHPGLFSACATLSAAVRTDEQVNQMRIEDYLRRYGSAMGDVKKGEERITDFWNQNNILNLVHYIPENQKMAVRFYLDVSDADYLFKGNSLLHIAMHDLEIPHEYRVRDGYHNWEYWREGLPGVLDFINNGFNEKQAFKQ